MKKTVLLIMTAWLSAATCFSAPITRSQARAKASEFLTGKQLAPQRTALKAAAVNGVKTGDNEPYYVFNVGNQEGFVVVSGDDRTTPVLGYTDKGSFDESAMPIHVKSWLQSYEDQIKYLQANESAQLSEVKKVSREGISPMIVTKWNQLLPYNQECPNFFTYGRSVVGCVAVAMGQLMYYHQWPAETKADIPAYDCNRQWGTLGRIHVEGVAKGTKLNWKDMKTSYPDEVESEDPAAKAVAALMRICGASVQMDYADEANGSSLASNNYAAEALMQYFDYAKVVKTLYRENYSYAEWESMIYDEINAKRPVLFGGSSSVSGHSFLVDGYLDGFFHINWGWGGNYDGYFVLSVLNPGSEGATSRASRDGYTLDQTISIGIKKNEGEKSTQSLITSIYNLVQQEGTNFIQIVYWNNRPFAFSGKRGIATVEADGSLKLYGDELDAQMDPYARQAVGFPIYNLQDGTYKFVPVSRPEGNEEWIADMDYEKEYVEAVVTDGKVQLTWRKPAVVTPNLTVTSFDYPSKHRIGYEQEVDVNIKNNGEEFYGPVYMFTSYNKGEWKMQTKGGVTVLKDSSFDVSFYFTPKEIGTYGIRLTLDEAGTQIIGESSLDILSQGELGENLYVNSVVYDNIAEGVVKAPYLSGKLMIENKGKEEFDGEILVYLLSNSEARGNFSLAKVITVEAIIEVGGVKEVPFVAKDITSGWYFWPLVDINGQRKRQDEADIVKFEYDITAVESVKASVKGDDAWYTISGQRVAKPTKGLYIHGGKRVLVR